MTYHVDPAFPPPGQFKGAVTVTLKDGRVFDEVEEYNRGSAQNPMTEDELRAKFHDNAARCVAGRPAERVSWTPWRDRAWRSLPDVLRPRATWTVTQERGRRCRGSGGSRCRSWWEA